MSERNQHFEYALEGIDNGGKTTCIKLLKTHYEEKGLKVEVLLGLSDTPLGRAIRRNIRDINAMGIKGMKYLKEDIRRSYKSLIEPNGLIFWDRHIYSMYAANAACCDMSTIREARPIVPEPPRVFLMNVSPDIAWTREQSANKADHPITPEWLIEKHNRYLQLAKEEPERFHIIDAEQPLNDVFSQLISMIDKDLSDK